jgi:hypothetical protein
MVYWCKMRQELATPSVNYLEHGFPRLLLLRQSL